MVEEKRRKGRGPGKKPALVCTSLRLPRYVLEYFENRYMVNKQAPMREVLVKYVDNQLQIEGAKDGNSRTTG